MEAWRPITMRELIEADGSEGAPDASEAAEEAMQAAGHGLLEVRYINWVGEAGLVAVRNGDVVVLRSSEGQSFSVAGRLPLPGANAGRAVQVFEVAAADQVGEPGEELWVTYALDGARAFALISLSPLEVVEHVSPLCEFELSIADRDCDGDRELRIETGC